RRTPGAASSAAGSAPTADAPLRAATAGRRAPRGSAAVRATAGSTSLRTSPPSRGGGCRSRSGQARRDSRRDSRSTRSRRRRLRGRLSVLLLLPPRSDSMPIPRPDALCPLLCLFRNLRRQLLVARELLEDREQARVEEPDLEEHQERQRAVDLVDERVEHRRAEIDAERQLDERLHADLLLVLLAGPLVAVALDAVLRRARELALLAEQRLEHRARVVHRQADADRHEKRQVLQPRAPVGMQLAL